MIKHIVIHCSDSPQGRGDNAETIHKWHLEKGWSGIGYHRVILETGEVQSGRPLYWKGAHAKGYNDESIGICLIGNGTYTFQQWRSLRALCYQMLGRYPKAKVVGHNYFDASRGCPMFDVEAWWRS